MTDRDLGSAPTPEGSTPLKETTTLEIARLVADHWRKAALTWGDQPIPGRIMAHPLCCVLDALKGKSARPEDFGVTPNSVEGMRIAEAGYRELGALTRSEGVTDAGATPQRICSHGKLIGVEHCNRCQFQGFCDCPKCRDHA